MQPQLEEKSSLDSDLSEVSAKAQMKPSLISSNQHSFGINPSSAVEMTQRDARHCRTIKIPKKISHRINGEEFVLYKYYKPIEQIGKGAYACVIEAVDTRSGMKVAIKKNKNVFAALTDSKRILRELKLMLHMDHNNIMGILDAIIPNVEDRQSFDDVYLVMPRMDVTLGDILKSNQMLSEDHIQYFTFQMLRALQYMHSINVIHRDLKPDNILINRSDCRLRITDFGLSRAVTLDDPKEALSRYVVTRYYRAPELLCYNCRYSCQVDIWSVGCIVAEMYRRRPFLRGGNRFEQLTLVLKHCGGDIEQLQWIETDEARNWVKSTFFRYSQQYPKRMQPFFANANASAIDLIAAMLTIDPSQRISVGGALTHPFLQRFQSYYVATKKHNVAPPFDLSFEFEQTMKTQFGVRHLMWEELKTVSDQLRSKLARRRRLQSSTANTKGVKPVSN